MDDQDPGKLSPRMEQLFRQVSSSSLGSDPFLSTRVLSELRSRKQNKASHRFWQFWAVGASALSLALAVALFAFRGRSADGRTFSAFVDHPFVVKMEVADLREMKVARAQVLLPEGVSFATEQFPELRNQHTLSLNWHNQGTDEFVPLVLTASQAGTKRITVLFFDEHDGLIGQKTLDVQLKAEVGHG